MNSLRHEYRWKEWEITRAYNGLATACATFLGLTWLVFALRIDRWAGHQVARLWPDPDSHQGRIDREVKRGFQIASNQTMACEGRLPLCFLCELGVGYFSITRARSFSTSSVSNSVMMLGNHFSW